jgi:hypothetical protein
MLRAGSGQLGTAIVGALPPETMNRPRLIAIASSNGSFALTRPLGGNVWVNVSVAIVSVAGPLFGREMMTVRLSLSHRSWI